MPRQLYRIEKAIAYRNHPLKKEYEAKKAEIAKKNKGLLYYLGWMFIAFSWIMVPGYFVLFIVDEATLTTQDHSFAIIFLG